MKTIGIVAHSYEGGTLCFKTACQVGQQLLGEHMHPDIVVSAIPMGLSMVSWETGDMTAAEKHLRRGVEQVAAAGADFFICPDNTAHVVFDKIVDSLPIPGLHIAHVIRAEIEKRGFKKAGLLGTEWTMTGPVYPEALEPAGIEIVRAAEATRKFIDTAIFDELCQSVFRDSTVQRFVQAADELKAGGADCVILGCTEIPLILGEHNSPLPTLDTTRLLARYAVKTALADWTVPPTGGWLSP